ncbi:MAG: hypothetical protein JXB43_02225 [Dehalococcoidia bacterium]|nr:hypothetical protein [Dehalococcoidia bacterium]
MKKNLFTVFALAALVTLGLIANLGCGSTGCADVYLEGVTIGSMSFEGKPLSGLPSQKVDIVLNVNANRVTISTNGEDTTITLSPSSAVIVSSPNGITFTGVKPEQIEIKWQAATGTN